MWKVGAFFFLLTLYFIYTGFIYTQGTEIASPKMLLDTTARNGKVLFQKHNCIACHQLFGLGGYLGPDLTNVISLKTKAYARVIIENGTLAMPNFNFSPEEVDALLAYLTAIDTLGNSPPRSFNVQWNGTVVLQ